MQSIISPETRARLIQEFHPRTRRGFIKMIIIIVIGIVLISVLGFDIRSAVEHPQTQTNFSYLGQLIADLWNAYLAPVWAVVWNIVGPVFEWFWGNAESFSWDQFNGDMGDFIDSVPTVDGGQ